MSKRRGLGRGLSELIPAVAEPAPGETVSEIQLELIDPNPYQPRREFKADELKELADSIKAQGLLQPVILRRMPRGRYQLVAGERRLRATRDLGRLAIKAIIREYSDDRLLELSLVENLIRADLNEIEVAQALQRLQNQYGYTTVQLAEVIGKSRPAVSNTLRLLELPASVQEMVRDGRLSAGHGRTVLSFPVDGREQVARDCAAAGWSVRELERRAARAQQRQPVKRPRKKNQPAALHPALTRAERQLMEYLATKVSVSRNGDGGTISITYHNQDDLQRILDLLLRQASPL